MTFVVSAAAGYLLTPHDRPPAELDHRTPVVAGLELGWNPAYPQGWSSIQITGPEVAAEPLAGLLGAPAARSCLDAVRRLQRTGAPRAEVPGAAEVNPAGLRLAAAEFLDRWLYLPLDQALVDAEGAAAHLALAEGLPEGGAAHGQLLGQALRRARAASGGVVAYLENLQRGPGRPPARLVEALRGLVGCYVSLGERVGEFDAALAAVPRAWQGLAEGWPGLGVAGPVFGEAAPEPEARGWRQASFVDPRQLPARLVRLGSSPSNAEIALREQAATVRVRVRTALTLAPGADRSAESRLLARLINRRTGRVAGYTLLSPREPDHDNPTELGGRHLEGSLPLSGARLGDLRADVFDAFSEVPPAWSDRDQGLHRARRAVHFLRAWRSLVAEVVLGLAPARPAERLTQLVRSLGPPLHDARKPDQELWQQGPAASAITALAGLGDAALIHAIEHDELPAPFLRAATGPGGLLAAELAAAYHPVREPVPARSGRRQVT